MHQIKGDSVAPFILPVEISGYSQFSFILSKHWPPPLLWHLLSPERFLGDFRGSLILFCLRPFLSEDVQDACFFFIHILLWKLQPHVLNLSSLDGIQIPSPPGHGESWELLSLQEDPISLTANNLGLIIYGAQNQISLSFFCLSSLESPHLRMVTSFNPMSSRNEVFSSWEFPKHEYQCIAG